MTDKLKDPSPLEQMIQYQIVDRGIHDARIIQAMRSVPRERFFPDETRSSAFEDNAASIGHGQTISQPYIVALMTQRLDVRPGQRVLDVGTGSGYQAAILAAMGAEVYTVERVKPLLDAAWERLATLGLRNIHFRFGDGTLGWPDMPAFDRILIGAGAPKLPEKLLTQQLKIGGIAVLPVGAEDQQMLVEVRNTPDGLTRTDIGPCRFVKLVGAEGWGENE